MEYNSFYGGRRGASFVIAKRYSTIAEMVAAFSQGGDYKTVNYDEYVLIDTENKNNPDNGKIYRRGYEYNNAMGGAIYEGQIVGPAGLAPHTEMHTIDEVEQIEQREDFTYRRGSGEYSPVGGNIIPGKYVEPGTGIIKYNDKISWAYCSVRDMNSHESTAHIGFKFPYTVIDYTTTSVSTYRNGDYADTSEATRIDDGSHPFFEKWNISIPKGVKGDAFKNFRVMIADNTIQSYTGQADDIANNRQVLVYDYYHYDEKENGDMKTYYVGDYNKISNITVSATGLVTIEYTHDDDDTYQLRIPISVSINTGSTEGTGTQKVVITYANGDSEEIGQPLNYIMATAIDNRYHLLVYYADPAKRSAFTPKATYNGKNDWADLGYIGNGTGVGAIAGEESDSGVISVANTMPPYSAWLIVEDDGEPGSI